MDFIFQNVLNALQWGSFYALIALGYSMVYSILMLFNFAHGDMVAAFLHDRQETTLKHFYLEGKKVRLQPANPFMDPIYADAEDVEIQGRVIMVLRRMN